MKLTDIAFRSTIILALAGTFYHGIHAVFIREHYSDLTPPWGVFLGVSGVTFWGILRCITPKKWW